MNNYTIRSVIPDDAPSLRGIYAYYVENTAVSFEYDVPTEEEFVRRIKSYQKNYPYLCICDGDEILGFAFAHALRERPAYDYSAETSIYLRYDCRHMGLGRLIYTALEEELKEMGVTNLYACIALPDGEDEHLSMDSPLFHKALGYARCGTFLRCGRKFGRWYTMIWMEKLIAPHVDEPKPLNITREVIE